MGHSGRKIAEFSPERQENMANGRKTANSLPPGLGKAGDRRDCPAGAVRHPVVPQALDYFICGKNAHRHNREVAGGQLVGYCSLL